MKPAPRHDIPRSHMYSECLGGLVVCFKGQNAALHQLAVLLLPYREDSALLLSYRAYPDTEPILSLVMLVLVRLIVTPSDSNSPDRRDSWGSLGASRGCTERWACTALGACVAGMYIYPPVYMYPSIYIPPLCTYTPLMYIYHPYIYHTYVHIPPYTYTPAHIPPYKYTRGAWGNAPGPPGPPQDPPGLPRASWGESPGHSVEPGDPPETRRGPPGTPWGAQARPGSCQRYPGDP